MVLRSARAAGPVDAVDQQDVQPAVAVVIEEGAARPQGFGQVLGAEGAAVVAELDAGGGGDVGQAEARAGRWRPERQGGRAEPETFAAGHAMLTRPLRMA